MLLNFLSPKHPSNSRQVMKGAIQPSPASMNQPGGVRDAAAPLASGRGLLSHPRGEQIRGLEPLPFALTLTRSLPLRWELNGGRGAPAQLLTHREDTQAAFLQNSSPVATGSGRAPPSLLTSRVPAFLVVTGNREVTAGDTLPPNCDTAECGSAGPHLLEGDPQGIHRSSCPERRARGVPLSPCAPRARQHVTMYLLLLFL